MRNQIPVGTLCKSGSASESDTECTPPLKMHPGEAKCTPLEGRVQCIIISVICQKGLSQKAAPFSLEIEGFAFTNGHTPVSSSGICKHPLPCSRNVHETEKTVSFLQFLYYTFFAGLSGLRSRTKRLRFLRERQPDPENLREKGESVWTLI